MDRRDFLRTSGCIFAATNLSPLSGQAAASGGNPSPSKARAALDAAKEAFPFRITAERFSGSHIIREEMLSMADRDSINGPSMLRVPDWAPNPLGRYYLYFAHHNGKYIRLATADTPEGPWRIHPGGVLSLSTVSLFRGHVASPEVVVDEPSRRILLYVHGRPSRDDDAPSTTHDDLEEGRQISTVAVSPDGLRFAPQPVVTGPAYLRVFRRGEFWYAVNGGLGNLYRSSNPLEPFSLVGRIIPPEISAAVDPALLGEPGAKTERPASGPERYSIRHPGIDVHDGWLIYYFTCVGHRPERILATALNLRVDPSQWRSTGITEILEPEQEWEGANLPLGYARGGRSRQWERGLRDPAVFREGNRQWLLYASAGEHGLGMARLRYEPR